MNSLLEQADFVRAALGSVSTCTPTISAALKELLQGREEIETGPSTTASKSRPTKTTQLSVRTKTAPTRTTSTSKRVVKKHVPSCTAQQNCEDSARLGLKEKATLATQVINATLKALGDTAKAAPVSKQNPRSAPMNTLAKDATRNVLRRSISMPTTPLRPRSLNRVSTSPAATKTCRAPASPPLSTSCLATIECARVAFATLRQLQDTGAVFFPDLQLETGMSSFVNKLIGLSLYDQALKELRILKRRLERIASGNATKGIASDSGTVSKTLSDLLDYPKVPAPGPLLGFIISTQLQALRVLHGLKKSAHLGAMLPFLRESSPSSPLNLLLLSLEVDKSDPVRCSKQFDNLSQSLLSLTPSLSSKDDGIATEPRLSPCPEAALEVQTLGLLTKLHSWQISRHQGDVDNEMLSILAKCMGCYARRMSAKDTSALDNAFSKIWQKIEEMGLKPTRSSKSPLSTIYELMARTCRDAGYYHQAKKWAARLRDLTNPKDDSAAKRCAVTAQLLALSLKDSPNIDEILISEVIDGLQGSLSGNVVELDDLLTSTCLLRKFAMNILTQGDSNDSSFPQNIRQLLENFVFQLPRFAYRWLGKPPSSSSATKDFLRFEQRRQRLDKYLSQLLDSPFIVAKTLLDTDRLDWDIIDSLLQDALSLLENMGDSNPQGMINNPSSSYFVKISHFYYQQHLLVRRNASKTTEAASLRALRKSIDCVKNRTEAEQVKAQLLLKWERFADLCRASGRRDDAADALRSIRDHLVRQDIVTKITSNLASQPISESWQSSHEAALLSRTVCGLAKLDKKPNDWTWLLIGSDKATALEHDFYFIVASHSNYKTALDLTHPTVEALLRHYSIDEYPIRRLRTLIRLLIANVEDVEQVAAIRTEVEAALAKTAKADLQGDSGLVRYLPHLRALCYCATALADGDYSSPNVQNAVAEWKGVLSACRSGEELLTRIDDPEQLLTSLQGLVDLARIKGLQALATDILDLSARISHLAPDSDVDLQLTLETALSLQHLSLGHTIQAEKALQNAEKLTARLEKPDDIVVKFHLSAAEYHLTVGAFDKAEHHLTEARAADAVSSPEHPLRKAKGSSKKIAIAHASFLTSTLALERGRFRRALQFGKSAVNVLFQDWSQLEGMRSSQIDTSVTDISHAETSGADMSLDSSALSRTDLARVNVSPEFWALVYPLFRFISRLSAIYAHLGLYQETVFYAERALKVARSMEAPSYIAHSTAWLASVSLKAGELEKAVKLGAEIRSILIDSAPTCDTVKSMCMLAPVFRQSNDLEIESQMLSRADLMLKDMMKENKLAQHDLEASMEKLSIKEKPLVKTTGRVARTVKPTKPTIAKKPLARRPIARKAVSCVESQFEGKAIDAQLSFLQALLLQSRSVSLLDQKDWAAASIVLRQALELSKLSTDLSHQRFLVAQSLLGQSLEQMGQDSVFSFIQDSTLSFPSVAISQRDKASSDRSSLTKATPPRKGRSPVRNTQSFVESLREAQEYLLEAHSIASFNGNGNLVHRIATVLQNVVILLSTTNSSKYASINPSHATCSIELARNLTWQRERRTVHHEIAKEAKRDSIPTASSHEPRRSSIGPPIDMNHFQKEYVDIIPKSWKVISVSLSDNGQDLCITKFQAGRCPFAIRLPLERASSRDADNEVFTFQQGRSELLEIVQAANRNCHDARDMSEQGAKSAWWAEREELDNRMRDLMVNVEQLWLGGFRGIFSQHYKCPDLLARFHASFQDMLDKHLPSRRQVRGRRPKAAPTKVNLDPRILDLFIGLGDATAPQCDLDEPLTDLLYFVVDVLQFHGETNAYDEIDFDDMVVQTFDALHSYHAAAKNSRDAQEDVHTILILDKPLHIFPWESLPSLQNLAVSRVPSLACLRQSILQQQPPPSRHLDDAPNEDTDGELLDHQHHREGHYASIKSGTYILNPGADLKNTQATFGKPLSTLPLSWTNIETRAPTESEFESALTSSDLLLYFGHGSGAQYIRGRTIRKLERCRAVALLMGCSSASLAEVGEFECYGTVWNYMLAGSPAVVGTLWDVTDRDIDRFAGRMFEEWGVFGRGTFAEDVKGKGVARRGNTGGGSGSDGGKKKADKGREREAKREKQTSLVEAVALARDACRFRYLTAAAVCVYGIPVYISK